MAYIDQEVRRLLGKAIYEYELIGDGDRIAVAVSGGKDSMLLLWLLRERLSRIPVSYELIAVHVDPGFDPRGADQLESFFVREGFRHEVIRTDQGQIAHGPANKENPCFLCARLRRTTLFRKAHELGCAKIAMGHNQDDLIETFFINICYGAQVAGMVPKQPFFDGALTVIRPLALVPAAKVLRLTERLGLPIVPTCCPSAPLNKRQEMRTMLEGLYRKNPKVRGNIFHAMSHVNLEYLPPALGTRKGRADPARPGKGRNGSSHDGTCQDILPR